MSRSRQSTEQRAQIEEDYQAYWGSARSQLLMSLVEAGLVDVRYGAEGWLSAWIRYGSAHDEIRQAEVVLRLAGFERWYDEPDELGYWRAEWGTR